MPSNPSKADFHQENAIWAPKAFVVIRGSSSSISCSCHGWASSHFGWSHSKLSYEVRTPQETWREKTYPSFCNLILQTWLVKWYWNLWRLFRITGNPETIYSPSPQHRKREGWLQKPAVVFVRAPGCPWKSVTIYLVFDLLTRLTSYIYIGVIIHLLSTMEIHEHASSLPGWAGRFFQILNFF